MAVEGAALARTQASSRVLSTLALLRSMSVCCRRLGRFALLAARHPIYFIASRNPFHDEVPTKLDLSVLFFEAENERGHDEGDHGAGVVGQGEVGRGARAAEGRMQLLLGMPRQAEPRAGAVLLLHEGWGGACRSLGV